MHTDGDHLHVSAVKVALQGVHILCNDYMVLWIELATVSMVFEGRGPSSHLLLV